METPRNVRSPELESPLLVATVSAMRCSSSVTACLSTLEKGRRATGYPDLVPAYLPAAPVDPTTGKPIAHSF
ncbi:MAG: hypothetical protein ACKODH_06725 [Limisphaerales bacterium]